MRSRSPRVPKPYNPLEKRRLAESIVRELLTGESEPLDGLEPFLGAGIYAIYYRGAFEPYLPPAALNAEELVHPIYVGQATTLGRRKGALSEFSESPSLFNRLGQHAASIRQASNLEVGDFLCRYLVADEFWISLAESLLIESYKPLWNVVIDGFGNHDPGAGRHLGKRPSWDALHPGRAWAERLQPSSLTTQQIIDRVGKHFGSMNRDQRVLSERASTRRIETLEDPRTMNLRKRTNWRPFFAPIIASATFGLSFKARNPNASLLVWFFFGVGLGLIFMVLFAVDRKIRLRNFVLNALAHASIYSLMLTLAFALIYGTAALYGRVSWKEIADQRASLAASYAAFLLWMFIIFSIMALSKKLGKGVLWNWMRGYYHQPRTEERVVMFLDLQGSTELADKLGDEKFSAFIRDFFADLTRPVVRCKGEISHYIGDEAVITWRISGGPILARPLQCFYAFDHALALKGDQYVSKYGFLPRFKAGVHVGPVVVTEVGEVKSEFVLHGDTLNVASRIQGLCSGLGERVLLSSALASRLRPERWFTLEEKGAEHVKGKAESVGVVAARLKGG